MRDPKGITLIALIITIIVLLIIATISINTIFNNNFINLAIQGTVNYTEAQTDEQMKMEKLAVYLEEAINRIEGENVNIPDSPNITPDSTPDLFPIGWDRNKVVTLESDDGVKVPVPKGFTLSNNLEERKVDNGLVIKQDGTNNEFVWVPTDSTFGPLYNFSSSEPVEIEHSSTGYREPDILTEDIDKLNKIIGITGSTKEVTKKWREQLEKEYNEMKTSVATYGGFYIGRYETGNLSKLKAVVEQGNTDIASQNWYTMYQKSKTIAEGTQISSSMIWGCQWDATMKWFLSSKNSEVIKYVIDSTGKGNYLGTQANINTAIIIPAGSNTDYAVNNIFDMAGNVWETNCECYDISCRGMRGGYRRQ